MKPNLQDYPKFYRWLTLPFTREATSCAGPSKDESNPDVSSCQASTAWSFVGCF